MRGLTGKVVVVAGGGTSAAGPGIGAMTAIRAAEEGASVAVGDLDEPAARATADLVTSAGGRALAAALDVTDAGSVESFVTAAADTFGRIDGLHVNAADLAMAMGEDGTNDALGIGLDAWNHTLTTNLGGTLNLIRAVLPHLLAAGGGSIVTMSSDAAFIGEPVRAAYGASKAAIPALTRHVASRWGSQGVRANCVAPGFVLKSDAEDARLVEALGAPERSTRYGRPADIAAAVCFLLSDDGVWVNGQLWSINGGTVLR